MVRLSIDPGPVTVVSDETNVTASGVRASLLRPYSATSEESRQRAIEGLLIADAAPEERFDRLTRLAKLVFDVPMAAITLAEKDYLWRKSYDGITASKTPRSQSFCDTTIRTARPVVVEDARLHPEFNRLPTVARDKGIRFYAGYPLADATGVVVGTFCLFDVRPRTLDEHQLAVLAELAGWAEQELTNSAEMNRAREVQQNLLPRHTPDLDGYDVEAICLPAQMVGGDFYDYARFGDGFGFCVADVMGKGTGAAIVTAGVRAVLRAAANRVYKNRHPDAVNIAASVLTGTNRAMYRELEGIGSLVTAFVAYVEGSSGLVSYADAGHGLTVVIGVDGTARWLHSADLPLGIDPTAVWTEYRFVLEPGETLLCFSDGLLDLLGGNGEALDEIAQMARVHADPRLLIGQIRTLATLRAPTDDVTALALRRNAAA